MLGLAGEAPDAIEPDRVDAVVQEVAERKYITLPNGKRVSFDPAKDVIFDYGPALPGHANGMIFTLWDASGAKVFSETYYSIGGGFVQTEAERLESKSQDRAAAKPKLAVPYPFSTAKEMLEMGKASGLSIAEMKRANETCVMTAGELDAKLDRIWAAMNACMNRGLSMGWDAARRLESQTPRQ